MHHTFKQSMPQGNGNHYVESTPSNLKDVSETLYLKRTSLFWATDQIGLSWASNVDSKNHSTCLRFLGPLRNPHMQLIFLAWPTLSSQDFMMLGAAFGGQGVCLGLGGVSQEFCKQSIYKS